MITKIVLILLLACITVAAFLRQFDGKQWSNLVETEKKRTIKQQVDDYAFEKWTEYKGEYNKNYSEEEEKVHLVTFVKNLIYIEKHNQDLNKSFEMGVNQLTDLPFDQYRGLNGFRANGNVSQKDGSSFLMPFNVQVPDQLDWRSHGLVTEVKDQGNCGSCWAFSATGALEGQHARQAGKLVSLSEQNLIDCSASYGNKGCNGGTMDASFDYIEDNRGVDTEISYPYLAYLEETCHFNRETVGADDKGYVDLPHGDENALKVAVATQGPISVAIDANHISFMNYKSGIYYEPACSSQDLDHGVLLVGYGSDPNHGDYWLMKNSWGTHWGEDGYVRMARNRNNHCGIATWASYPLV